MAACLMKFVLHSHIFQLIRKPLSKLYIRPRYSYPYTCISLSRSKHCFLFQQILPFDYTDISFRNYSYYNVQNLTFYSQELPQITFTLESYNGTRQQNASLDFCVFKFSFSPKIPIYK